MATQMTILAGMDNVERGYSGVGRRLAAHLVDLVILFSVLILHGLMFRMLRAAGIWKMTNAEPVSPEELWHSFGVAPKIAVLLALVVTSGLIYFLRIFGLAGHPGKAHAEYLRGPRRPYVPEDGPRGWPLAGEVVCGLVWGLLG